MVFDYLACHSKSETRTFGKRGQHVLANVSGRWGNALDPGFK
jgi:hypothetical protein